MYIKIKPQMHEVKTHLREKLVHFTLMLLVKSSKYFN